MKEDEFWKGKQPMNEQQGAPAQSDPLKDNLSHYHPAMAAKLRSFRFSHLPPHLQEISAPFYRLARRIADAAPNDPSTTIALNKLMEAKDWAVRAHVAHLEMVAEARVKAGLAGPGVETQ